MFYLSSASKMLNCLEFKNSFLFHPTFCQQKGVFMGFEEPSHPYVLELFLILRYSEFEQG